jgi:hypothetical protein
MTLNPFKKREQPKLTPFEPANEPFVEKAIIYSIPRLFDPLLMEGVEKVFEELAKVLETHKGIAKGDLVIVMVRRNMGTLKASYGDAKISEYLASNIFRWTGDDWKTIFGSDFHEVREQIRALKIRPHWLSEEEAKPIWANRQEDTSLFEREGKWYFSNKVWTELCGPYDTEEEATLACTRYARSL